MILLNVIGVLLTIAYCRNLSTINSMVIGMPYLMCQVPGSKLTFQSLVT